MVMPRIRGHLLPSFNSNGYNGLTVPKQMINVLPCQIFASGRARECLGVKYQVHE